MRRGVLIALVLFTFAAPAHAAPRALTRISGLSEIAPAGEQILFTRMQGANLRVFAIPVSGGAARPVFSFDVPKGLRFESADLAASPQRAGLTITMVRSFRDAIRAVLAFAGPPRGGWIGVPPFTDPRPTKLPDLIERIQVDGERIFTTETRDGFDDLRVVVRDAEPHEVAFGSDDEAELATFSGDLVAYRAAAPGELVEGRDLGNMLVVRDWPTGALISSADLPDDIGSIALSPNGRAAASTVYSHILYELRPGSPPRALTRQGGAAAYAGDALVYSTRGGLRVIDANGHIRRFGAPTAAIPAFATDGSRVIWVANDCLLVDDVSAPSAAAPDPGPCPRSELALAAQPSPHLAHTLPVVLACVAAPRACRGALRLTTVDRTRHLQAISRPVHFSIPAGKDRRLHVPLTGRGYRLLRRNVEHFAPNSRFEDDPFVIVDARTDDGERFPGQATADGELLIARDEPQIQPPTGASPAVREVYNDFLVDGTIDICAHSVRALKQTLATIEPKTDTDFPDFRPAIEAGIDRHANCTKHDPIRPTA
jgi:hypothetical protein